MTFGVEIIEVVGCIQVMALLTMICALVLTR